MIRRPPRSTLFPYRRSSDLQDVSITHEATVSKVSDEQLFYLMSRGVKADRKSTRLNSSHSQISYAVFCLKKKKKKTKKIKYIQTIYAAYLTDMPTNTTYT